MYHGSGAVWLKKIDREQKGKKHKKNQLIFIRLTWAFNSENAKGLNNLQHNRRYRVFFQEPNLQNEAYIPLSV